MPEYKNKSLIWHRPELLPPQLNTICAFIDKEVVILFFCYHTFRNIIIYVLAVCKLCLFDSVIQFYNIIDGFTEGFL